MPALDLQHSGDNEDHGEAIEEVNVLVTGFGPFSGAPDTNASWSIANSLPSTLPLDRSHPSRIRIRTCHEPIAVTYSAALERVPTFYTPDVRLHFVIHMGVVRNRDYYAVEKLAHRDGYKELDVEGNHPDHSQEPKFWDDLPLSIETRAELDDVLARWREHLKKKRSEAATDSVPKTETQKPANEETDGEELRVSTNAGRYLCEYLYFTSLAHSKHNGYDTGDWRTRTTTVFAHTPVDYSPDMISRGCDVIVALIRALVDSRLHRRDSL